MSSCIYARLAVTNIRNNKKTYVPFLLTSVLTVMMYYIMDSLARSRDIGNQNVTTILMLALGILILFSVIFLFYTNSFLIKRRKKELAVYNILGMGKGHIAKMLTVETLLIGASSMALGILGGLVFGRLMHLVLLRLLRHDIGITFRVSGISMVYTVLLFAGIFFLIWLYNLFQVRLASPAELLQGSAAGEREPKTKRILALAGLAALGTGYYLAVVTDNPLEALNTFFVAALLVVIGTYAIFLAGSIAILKALRRRKSFYYKPNHFTVVSGMIYRMKQNAVGLANICILSTMVLVMISTTVSLYAGMDSIMDRRFPYDFGVRVYGTDARAQVDAIVEEELSARGVEEEDGIAYRYGGGAFIRQDARTFTSQASVDYTADGVWEMYFIPLEDYRALENDSTPLAAGQVIVYSAGAPYGENAISVEGQEFQVAKEVRQFKAGAREKGDDVTDRLYVVMPDEASILDLGAVNASYGYVRYFDMSGTKADCEDAVWALADRIQAEVPGSLCENRLLSEESFFELYGSLFFIGLYLGIMFLMATVLIIYYKQVSEGFDDRERYRILRKVGMGMREIRRSVRSQVLLVFFLPLLMAVLHVAVAFNVVNKLLVMMNFTDTKLFMGCTAATVLFFALLYAAVFAVTARQYYQIVNE